MVSFQKKIYQIVKEIPKGKVLSYKDVARKAGRPRAWRAVGNVLNESASLRIKIPCHRIIKSDTRVKRSVEMKTKPLSTGKVGGYNRGIKKKIALLKKEGIIIKNGKITSRTTK